MDKVSIIITHWAMNGERSETMRVSLSSLFRTSEGAEIIIIDNGGSQSDSQWLLEQSENGNIACYIRNRKNMHFGYARNQGLAVSSGNFIVIADNDILFKEGWMEECVEFLNQNEGKFLATPIFADPMNRYPKRWFGTQGGWRLNSRAGSNVFMMRRADYEVIGKFELHRIAGSKFCDRYNRLGYLMALMPESKAIDMGLRRGYNLNEVLPHTDS